LDIGRKNRSYSLLGTYASVSMMLGNLILISRGAAYVSSAGDLLLNLHNQLMENGENVYSLREVVHHWAQYYKFC